MHWSPSPRKTRDLPRADETKGLPCLPKPLCTIIIHWHVSDYIQKPFVAGRRAGRSPEGQVRGPNIQGRRSAENEQHAGGKREKSIYRRDPRSGRPVRASFVRRANSTSKSQLPIKY